MARTKTNLRSLDYPGRLIILGQNRSSKQCVVIYSITGRSPSSQARKIECEEDTLWVKPTDKEVLKKGNIDLLVYPAAFILPQGIAVSNGKQTVDLMACLNHSENASEILAFSLQKWSYEPDKPTYTPRISGALLSNGNSALSILKRGRGGRTERNIFEFHLNPGQGRMIATYTGKNKDPLPSFVGEPILLDLDFKSPQEAAEHVYENLRPYKPDKDFRVSVACIFADKDHLDRFSVSIINRNDKKG